MYFATFFSVLKYMNFTKWQLWGTFYLNLLFRRFTTTRFYNLIGIWEKKSKKNNISGEILYLRKEYRMNVQLKTNLCTTFSKKGQQNDPSAKVVTLNCVRDYVVCPNYKQETTSNKRVTGTFYCENNINTYSV